MTSILALETSSTWCSVALSSGSKLIWRHEHTGPQSSQRILPMVQEVLAESGQPLSACDAIAFGAGPGAFTGLRTACGVAQGLAFGADLPVIAVNSLEICAEQVRSTLPTDASVLIVLDARMDEIYWAEYAWDALGEDWLALGPTRVDPPESIFVQRQYYAVAGNALLVFADRLQPLAAGAQMQMADVLPHAQYLAAIAQRRLVAGQMLAPHLASPLYIRDKVAQTTAERMQQAQMKTGLAAEGLA